METSKTTPHSSHLNLFSHHISPFHLGGAQDRCSTTLLPIRFHPLPPRAKKERPLRLSVSLLLHFYSLLIWAGIEPHPGPVMQDLSSISGDRVHAGWVAFLCMVCDQWCHRLYTGIYSPADYRRLATWSCPTCSTPVPPAAHTRRPVSSDLERTRSTLSSRDSLSQRSLSIGPSSPAQTSTAALGPALERGRFLQFNCNGILHCHAELQDFLHRHQVLVACVQETKLGVNSSHWLCHCQARSPDRRWRWRTCHSRPPLHPL